MLTWHAVNELSGTIDLPSTLTKAEALFRRFQRTVETIDKKKNFPAPKLTQRKPPADQLKAVQASQKSNAAAVTASGSDANTGKQTVGQAVANGIGAEKEKVISPELRTLLSRKVEKLDKTEVREHGGGVGT